MAGTEGGVLYGNYVLALYKYCLICAIERIEQVVPLQVHRRKKKRQSR